LVIDEQAPHQHIRLLAGANSAGRPVHEVVPAAGLPDGRYRIIGSPALVMGCAAGDIITVDEGGDFEIIQRGGNLAIQSYATAAFAPQQITALKAAFIPLGGLVEAPADGRFAVVTIAASVGFPNIESIMNQWAADTQTDWSYGNVYDDDGQPLNWW
jgi:hypothetical protein